MSEFAWDLFSSGPLGWGRVQAICDFVHQHITFGYEYASPTKTAWEVFNERKGVCRDFAHLAITLCRCLNIPARYCTGYLGDIGVPKDPAPMDFAGWFEAYLGGAWHTFDPAQQRPAHRARPHRARPRRRRRRDHHDLRTEHPGELPRLDRRSDLLSSSVSAASQSQSRLTRMTYCVGVLLKDGIVLGSDSRTHAGVDNFASFCKMTVFERPGERVLVLLSSGSLAGTQAVISVLTPEGRGRRPRLGPSRTALSLLSARTMFDVAGVVSDAMRAIEKRDKEHLEKNDLAFNASFILGGQIRGEPMRLFRIYAEGNFIEAGADTPFFQTGEAKYGKPIMDRVIDPLHQPERRGQVRPGLVRLDHAQQSVGRDAHRSALLRARRSSRSESAADSNRAIPTSAPSARSGARASAPPSRSCPSRCGAPDHVPAHGRAAPRVHRARRDLIHYKSENG